MLFARIAENTLNVCMLVLKSVFAQHCVISER